MIKEKYISRIKETSLNVVQTSIDSIRKKDITKTGVRIYNDGKIGVAGAIGSFDEKQLEEQAKAALNNNIPYTYDVSKNLVKHNDYSEQIIEDDKIVSEFESVLEELRRNQPEFIFSNKINIIEREVKLSNDAGLDLLYRNKTFHADLCFKEKTSVSIIDGGVTLSGRRYDRKEFIDSVNEICDAYKKVVDLPETDRIPVIFDSEDFLPLKKLYEDLNGQRFGTKSSLLSDKIEQRVFSEDFTLYQSDDPEEGNIFFDAEGTVNDNYRFLLIENGVINAPYTDKKVADKFGLKLTGAAAGEYDGVPMLGYPSLVIKPSNKTAKELLKGRPGIFVLIASGGDFTHEGDFGTPVQVALLFDGEKFIGRLPELQISSNVFKMFGEDFIGVSSDKRSTLSNSHYLVMEMNVSKL